MQAQTQLTTVDIPSATAAFAQRIAQAVDDNAANLAAGADDRAQWLGDLQTGNSQAIAAAQATLASSNVGGDPAQVSVPGDLAVPTNLDLGSVSLTSGYYNSWFGSPLGPGSLYWNGLGIGGTFGPGWGDVPFYAWDNDGAYGWSTSFWDSSLGPGWGSIGAYAWWGDAGMVAPEWTVFDPFGYGAGGYNGNYFANGFGAFNYGSWYGAAFGYWFGNWGWYGNGVGYSWLPFYAVPNAPSASTEPADAVQQEQTSINLLSTLATVGEDLVSVVKNAAPVEIQAATGLAKLGIAAGYAAINLATDGQPSTDQNGAPQQPAPLTQAQAQALSKFLEDGDFASFGDPDLWFPQGNADPAPAVDSWSALMRFNSRQGYHWDGRTVLEIIKLYEGEGDVGKKVAAFVAQHYRLGNHSDYSANAIVTFVDAASDNIVPPVLHGSSPELEIRSGMKIIDGIGGVTNEAAHNAEIDIGIPRSWNSMQVAEFILNSFHTDEVIRKIASIEIGGDEQIYAQLQADALRDAAKTAGSLAGAYYKMLVAFTPGGMLPLAVFDLGQGDPIGAALDLVFTEPVRAALGAAGGFIAFKVGQKVLRYIPVKAIEAFQSLGAATRETLLTGLRAAKTEEEATVQLAKIFKECGVEGGLAFATGDDGELFLKEVLGGGETQRRFTAKLLTGVESDRVVDVLKDAVANESKVGYVKFTARIREEIEKDVWLLKNRPTEVKAVVWHFFRSAETGKIGADPRILKILDDNGIKYVFYTQ